jgi:hypothetical protein
MTGSRKIDYQQLLAWRRSHPAWRLLLADHAPMIASFLHQAFVSPNARAIPRDQLASLLEDHLFRLHDAAGETLFPKAATAYLDDWASDARGWLRKYYPNGLDEPCYDLTPASELALGWICRLEERSFIGTEARLASARHALQEVVDGTEMNPRHRIALLRSRRADIDAEIARIEQGRVELMEPAQIRERVVHAADTLRALLSDQRAVEQGLRNIGRTVRERIASHEGPLPAAATGDQEPIAATDEGASFRLFRRHAASPAGQEALLQLIDKVASLEPVQSIDGAPDLRRLFYHLVDASEATEETAARISRQLRRQVDERTRLENRRLMQLLRGALQKALAVRERVPEGPFIEIDEQAPTMTLPMDRVLYHPPVRSRIRRQAIEEAPRGAMPTNSLFARADIDPLRLAANVRHALRGRAQVTLAEVVSLHPIRHGLAELAAYLELAAHDLHCAIDEARTELIHWNDASGKTRQASMPLLIYTL